MRPGTESMPLIAAFGAAVKALPDPESELSVMRELNAFLRAELAKLDGVAVNSPEDALPYILNFSAGGVRAETMLHFLSDRGVYVSSGSACSKGRESHVLKAMGLPRERIASALRLSFCRFNTKAEAKAFIAALRDGLASITKRPL
jgi:cysteine desulfurase